MSGMVAAIKLVFIANYKIFAAVFIAMFLIGLVAGLSTMGWNKERKKKGFHGSTYRGHERAVDKYLYKSYKEPEKYEKYPYMDDGIEYHANKKYK